MKIITFLAIFLLASCNLCFAEIECGTTISSPGTYTLEADKVCAAEWITIAASGVTIQGSGHTVVYGNSTTSHGIKINDGHENLALYNFVLTQGPSGGDGLSAFNADIGGLKVNAVTFNLSINPDRSCIHATYGTASNIDIQSSVFNVDVVGQGWGIFFDGTAPGGISGGVVNNTFIMGENLGAGRPAAIRLGYSGASALRPLFTGNTISIAGETTTGWLGWGTDNWVIANNTITLTETANNCKGIQIDGGSSNNEIYGNTIEINSTDNESASYGVRVRFASTNNTIRDNSIDISGSSGTYGALGISIGADQSTEPTAPPSNIFVYRNSVTGSGSNIPVQIYEDLEESYFYCNSLLNPSGYTVTTYSGGAIDTVEFSGNTHVSDGDAIRIVGAYTISGLSFCNESVNGAAMSVADVTDSSELGGWAVAASGCEFGCVPDPEDPDPEDPTPTTSGPILRTGSHLLRVGGGVLSVQ